MKQHFLQSKPWQRFQQEQGKTTFRQAGDGWEFMAILETTKVGSYLYLPYGPTIANKNAFKSALEALQGLAKDQRAVFIRIEPTCCISADSLRNLGFKKKREINPEHTWIFDLTRPTNDIFSSFSSTNRNRYNNYKKYGLNIDHTNDYKKINHLTSLLASVSDDNKFNTHSDVYFKSQVKCLFKDDSALLYYVEKDDKVIASALCYDDEDTRYYAHAAADYAFRKYSPSAILIIQAMLDAKSNNQKEFDFYGITKSTDKSHPWQGFTKFKKSFDGFERDYLGTWDLPLDKHRYRLFNTLREINRKLRRAKKLLKP